MNQDKTHLLFEREFASYEEIQQELALGPKDVLPIIGSLLRKTLKESGFNIPDDADHTDPVYAELGQKLVDWQHNSRTRPYAPELVKSWIDGAQLMPPEVMEGVQRYFHKKHPASASNLVTFYEAIRSEYSHNRPHIFNELNQTFKAIRTTPFIPLSQKTNISKSALERLINGTRALNLEQAKSLDSHFLSTTRLENIYLKQLHEKTTEGLSQVNESGGILRLIRESLGLTVAQAASKIEIQPPYLSQIELGSKDANNNPIRPTISTLRQIISTYQALEDKNTSNPSVAAVITPSIITSLLSPYLKVEDAEKKWDCSAKLQDKIRAIKIAFSLTNKELAFLADTSENNINSCLYSGVSIADSSLKTLSQNLDSLQTSLHCLSPETRSFWTKEKEEALLAINTNKEKKMPLNNYQDVITAWPKEHSLSGKFQLMRKAFSLSNKELEILFQASPVAIHRYLYDINIPRNRKLALLSEGLEKLQREFSAEHPDLPILWDEDKEEELFHYANEARLHRSGAEPSFTDLIKHHFPPNSDNRKALMEHLHSWQDPERNAAYAPELIKNWLNGTLLIPPQALSGALYYLETTGVENQQLEHISALHDELLDELSEDRTHPHVLNTLTQTLDSYLKSIPQTQHEVAQGLSITDASFSQLCRGTNAISEAMCKKLDALFDKPEYNNAPHFTEIFWHEKGLVFQEKQSSLTDIGTMLLELRHAFNMTEQQLATQIGVSVSLINQWENASHSDSPKYPAEAAIEDMIGVFIQKDEQLAARFDSYEPIMTDALIEQLRGEGKTVNAERNPAYGKYTPNPQNRIDPTHAEHSKPKRKNLRE